MNFIQTLLLFILHYAINLSDLLGNLNYLASNQLLNFFIPMPTLVGGLRPTDVLLPARYDPAAPAPLLIMLHEYADDKYETEKILMFADEASARGYIYVMPNGIRNLLGERFWAATDACCDFFEMGWNDSQYLINLVDEISMKYSIDQKRIYFAGHSNGGFMAHRMACDYASRIAGIVSVAGMNYKDISKCKPTEPVNILHLHGTGDIHIPFNGGSLIGVEFPSAMETMNGWVSLNGCTPNSFTDGTPFSIISKRAGDETTPKTAACTPGGNVELWTMADAKHRAKFEQPSFSTKIFDWLDANVKV